MLASGGETPLCWRELGAAQGQTPQDSPTLNTCQDCVSSNCRVESAERVLCMIQTKGTSLRHDHGVVRRQHAPPQTSHSQDHHSPTKIQQRPLGLATAMTIQAILHLLRPAPYRAQYHLPKNPRPALLYEPVIFASIATAPRFAAFDSDSFCDGSTLVVGAGTPQFAAPGPAGSVKFTFWGQLRRRQSVSLSHGHEQQCRTKQRG